jgi:hypothetical protein
MTPRAYEGDEQRRVAEATKDALEGSSLRPAPTAQYRTGCGRD